MIFITVDKNIITGLFSSADADDLDLSGTPYEKHEKIALPDDKVVHVGDSLNYYVDWVRIPDVELIEKGIMEMPEGKKIEDGKLVYIKKENERVTYILDGKLCTDDTIPPGGEEYESELWNYDEESDTYTKKDSIQLKKEEIMQQLADLDISVSYRTMRQAALGDEYSIRFMKECEEKAAKLRAELAQIK